MKKRIAKTVTPPSPTEALGKSRILADVARQSTAESFQEIAERSPIGIAVIEPDGAFSFVNAAYCAIYDYGPDELIGKPFTMLFRAEQRANVLARHRKFLDGVDKLDGDWQVVRHDGTVLDVIALSILVQDAGGSPRRVVYVLDISERRRTERALMESQHFVQTVLDSIDGHICVIDQDGAIVTVNRAWCEFAIRNGASPQTVLEGANYLAVCEAAARSGARDAEEAGRFVIALRQLLAGHGGRFDFEYPCHAPDQKRWYSARLSPIEGSEPPRFVITHVDVTALKLAQLTLERQANTDELTGAPNRRHFLQSLKLEFERVRRHPNLESCLLALDLDHFKEVNDNYGHAAGDAVLAHVVQLISTYVRPIDILGRIGGEEFAIVLPECDVDSAKVLGQRLGQRIAACPLSVAGQVIRVTVSIGVTRISATDAAIDAALLRGDQALYDAKAAGRDTIRVCE